MAFVYILAFCPWHVCAAMGFFDSLVLVVCCCGFRDGACVIGRCCGGRYNPSVWSPFICVGAPVFLETVDGDHVDENFEVGWEDVFYAIDCEGLEIVACVFGDFGDGWI